MEKIEKVSNTAKGKRRLINNKKLFNNTINWLLREGMEKVRLFNNTDRIHGDRP